MAKINDTIVKRILDATHIEDVVGKFVELKKRGPRYLGLCPFHDDRHIGNFSVYPKGNCYKCFACDAKGDAVTFLMESQKMSFADAIRWLGKQVGIDVDGRNVDLDIKAYEPPPPLPTLFLPEQMVAATEVRATHNNLIAWLNGLPWSARQRERIDEVLAAYRVGTSKWGDAIFWQIDENGGVRDGKMMKYLPDGHRDKSTPYSINWVSRRLFKNGYFDEDKWKPCRCLFGLHLLTRYPTAEVHVVESEKTALFCAIYFGDPERHLWLATAGKGNLTKHILQPLIDARRVVALHPDKDGVEDWEARRKEINYKYAYINNSVMTLQWQPQDGEKADMADVLQRVMRDAQRDGKVRKMADIMPRIHTAQEMKIQQETMEKNYKEVQTKISIPIYRRLRRVLDKIGVTLYALIQNFIDVIIRFCDDRHNLTPETDALMSAFEGAEGWDKQFNLADFTTSPEIAEATYYLRDREKKGVRVVHVERPFFGQWTQTFNVKQILEKFLFLTFPHLYKRLCFIAVCRECNSILELLYSLVNDLEAEENRREFRKPFEDAERSEWGRYINLPRYKIKHRHTVDEMESPDLFAGDHDSFLENENEQ